MLEKLKQRAQQHEIISIPRIAFITKGSSVSVCYVICVVIQPNTKYYKPIIDFALSAFGEVLNFGLKVRSSLTLRIGVWAYTGSKDCLNVSLKAAIDISFICLW